MTSHANILADNISPEGVRLTTMQLRYPRIIHSEFMTHRQFSRNASSSRAIPLDRSIKDILEDPAEPVEWGANQRGMQAGEPLSGMRLWLTRQSWHATKRLAILGARVMQKAGAHKQIANRILEPWSHITVVVTSVYWENFFNLRDHKDADPTIRELARKMRDAFEISTPQKLEYGQWHLPYIDMETREYLINMVDNEEEALHLMKTVSAARCARTSYNNHGTGKASDLTSDVTLAKRLISDPVHATPFEHQATPDKRRPSNGAWNNPKLHGNLRGWKQNRKFIENEAIMEAI